MGWVFKILDRTARLWPLLGLGAVILTFRHLMQQTLAALRALSGEGIVDYEIGYSRARVLQVFDAYDAEGMALYERFMTFDLVFPLLYSLFFASLVHWTLAKTRFRQWAFFPLALAVADYIENAIFFVMKRTYPDISDPVVILANVFTIAKFSFGGLTVLAILYGVILFLRSRFKSA